jgi:hypothetical protein
MANSDSFINEVTEEVRRDRLFGFFRRWAWLIILIVVMLVGGAAWLEWDRNRTEARAQAFGDALLSALDQPEAAARIAALGTLLPDTPAAQMTLGLLLANEEAADGQTAEAAARLRALAALPDIARRYRDLALLKAHMLDPEGDAQAQLVLETLATPGAPYRVLAEEQLALMAVRAGDLARAGDILRRIENDAAATPGLQQRASQLIVALESGASLIDTATAPATDNGLLLPLGEAVTDPAPTDDAATPATDDTTSEDATATQ